MNGTGFLAVPEPTGHGQRILDDDVAEYGFVMNATRIWAYQADSYRAMFDLMDATSARAGLSERQRALVIAATASAFGDAYCSLGWGAMLAGMADADTATSVLQGTNTGLDPTEQALADWVRTVARNPNGATEGDLSSLREVGYTDEQIFAITLFAALRIAFSTVNDATGTRPDARLQAMAPESVARAVTFGRPVAD